MASLVTVRGERGRRNSDAQVSPTVAWRDMSERPRLRPITPFGNIASTLFGACADHGATGFCLHTRAAANVPAGAGRGLEETGNSDKSG